MLENQGAFASYSVDDTDKAKGFYRGVLGLDVQEGKEPGILELKIKHGPAVILYPKENHEPATFTVLNLIVPSVDRAVDELGRQGVKFEIYRDGPVRTDERGIMRGNGPTIAWFKDPAGNIISVVEVG